MTTIHGSTKDKPASPQNEAVHHASSSEQAAEKLAADAKGDPQRLAQILGSVHGNAQQAIVVAAQRLYGNQLVTAAFDVLAARLASPREPGAKFATDDTGTHTSTTGGQQRTDGTHGIGGNPTMFGGNKADAKSAHPFITGAQQGRYGDTFGAGRLGDQRAPMGGDNHKFGKGRTSTGFENHSGDASMSTCTTPTAGEPGAIAYPGQSTGDGKSKTDSTVGTTNGNEAGASRDVTSTTAKEPVVTPAAPSAVAEATTATATPRDDQDAAGGPVILSRGDAHGVEHSLGRQIDHNHAGGDGRGDTGNVGAGTGGDIIATQRETVGGREQDVEHGGSINFDAVLAINKLVNPGSA